MNEKAWSPDNEVTNVATTDDLELILSEAKDRVAETVQSKEIYYQRSAMILGVSITTLTVIISYLGSLGIKLTLNVLSINLIVVAFIMLYISYRLKNNLKPVEFEINGTDPKKLYTKDYFIGQPKPAKFIILYNLIKAYEKGYEKNTVVNQSTLDRLDESIDWLYRVPFLSMLIWAVGIILQLDFFS